MCVDAADPEKPVDDGDSLQMDSRVKSTVNTRISVPSKQGNTPCASSSKSRSKRPPKPKVHSKQLHHNTE